MSASVFEAAVLGSMCECGSMSRIESSSVKRRSRSWEDMEEVRCKKYEVRCQQFVLFRLLSVAFVAVGAGFCRLAVGGAGLVEVVEVHGRRNVAGGLLQIVGETNVRVIVGVFKALVSNDVGERGRKLGLVLDVVAVGREVAFRSQPLLQPVLLGDVESLHEGRAISDLAPLGLWLSIGWLRPIAADEVGKILLALCGFLICLIRANFAVAPRAREEIAKRRGAIFPAYIAVILGRHAKQRGQHAEVPAAVL